MFFRWSVCLYFVALTACERIAPSVAPPSQPPVQPAVPLVPAPAPAPTSSPTALVVVPAPPLLTDAGHDLIVEFEVGGPRSYRVHPEWPGARSGVTVGIGYDCGMMARRIILADWQALIQSDRTRLADSSGILGFAAKTRLALVRDIVILWADALDVFDRIDVARTFQLCLRAFPGFAQLRPNAQAALVSLVFNRGDSMSGPNRVEMRHLRDHSVPERNYGGIASDIRGMIHIWKGQDIYNGMARRREAEALLAEKQ